jgi:glycosyltransferase involved in cell wall biosynthesis
LKSVNILFVGKSLAVLSGLSYVSSALLKRFYRDDFKLGYINMDGPNMTPENVAVQGEEFKLIGSKIKLYNSSLLQPSAAGCVPFDQCLEDFKPQIVISIHDPWVIDQLVYSSYKDTFFWVHYATVEVPIYPATMLFPTPIHKEARKNIAFSLSTAHCIVPVTEMAKKALEKFNLKSLTDYVHLGIDLEKKQTNTQSKTTLFKVPEDTFIFMTLGVNSERKMHYRTLEAFKLFLDKLPLEEKNKVRMYVHTDTSKFYNGTDLIQLAHDLGIIQNTIFSIPNTMYSSKDVMWRFQNCDCYISLTGGEGFGYGFLEALLHEKPVIYSEYGGHVEICEGHGLVIPLESHSYAINASFQLGLADVEKAAEAMFQIYKDENLRKKLSQSALQTVKEKFDWNKQYDKFKKIVMDKYQDFIADEYYELHNTLKPKRII